MSQAAIKFCICVSIFWILICLAEGGRCPLIGVHQLVGHDACSSHTGNYNGLQNTFASYFGVHAGYQLAVPVTNSEDVCSSSELVSFPSAFYVFHSETQSSRRGNLDIRESGSGAASSTQSTREDVNSSWSSDCLMFSLPDGGTITCSLDYKELGHETSASRVNSADQIVLSSCRSHLLYQQASVSSKNIELEKHHSSDSSSPRVNISPSKLDWGQTYLYQPSVASLSLKNTCNETVLKVYEPFSTDTQFYPFNFSEVLLGPGEVISIAFVYLPKWLGSSSAELIVQTSLGGFLVEAKGFAVESPHILRPLVGLDVSSGGLLRRKLSLWNPFDETIHLEEVTTWVSVSRSSGPLLTKAICSKHNPPDSDKHSFSNSKKMPSVEGGKSDSVVMAVRPLSNWVIGPHRTESILQMAFSPDPEGQALGAICIQFLRPLDGEKDTLVVPFEAELNTEAWKDTAGPLSVSVEVVGRCDMNETTISVFVRNSALYLLKIVRISEVFDSKKLLQIKSPGELLLFPGTLTLVALATYESSNVNYDSFIEMADVSKSCMLEILTNDTISPTLEVPCEEIFGICSQQQQDLPTHQTNSVDFNRRTGYLTSTEKSSVLIKAFEGTQVDEFVLESWRNQSTMPGLHVLDDHELLFSMVPIGGHYAKSITVRNPSQQPIIVQLILESGEIMENCMDHHGHIQPSSSSSFVHDDSTKQTKHGFSIVDSTVTEAYLHPYETASLGPIFFHPSGRCEWKSSALVRNNLSGVEWLPLRGIGGLLSLVLLEGSEPVHRLEFNLNLPPPLNISSPNIGSDIQDATSSCYTPLSKKLVVFNVGDFPVKVKSIHVSGTKCELDGFIVLNCKSFSLEPGESVELGISYQTDFSAPLVQRDLELKLAAGVLVIPMKASLPLHMLNFCRKPILWVRVKKCCVFIVLAAILISVVWFLMPQRTPSCSVNSLTEGKKSSIHPVKPKYKSSTLHRDEGNGKSLSAAEHGGLKRVIIAEDTDTLTNGETETAPPSDSVKQISFPSTMPLEPELEKNAGETEVAGVVSLSVRTWKDRRRRQRKRKGAVSGLMSHIEVSSSQSGNSTPSSPLSPITNSFSHKDTCSPSPWKRESPGSSSPFICDSGDSYDKGEEAEPDLKANGSGRAAVSPARDAGNQSDNHFSTRLQPPGPGKTGSRPMLLPSATFPAMGRSATVSPPCPSTPSRLPVSPHARAPGPKPQKVTQGEEQAKREDRFAYDIWGNHLSGLHLTSTGVTDQSARASIAAIEGDSDSFFSRGPQQILFTSCRSRSVK